MKKVRIGHIGTLHDHSLDTLIPLMKMKELFEVVGVVYESDERYEELKNTNYYKDLPRMTMDEMLSSGIDAAVLEGSELESVAAAKKCVDNGIHVHIDKPAGIDIKAFEEVLRIAKSKNLVVQMGYMYRYNPEIKKLFADIKNGEFGEIYSVEAQMSCSHPAWKRQWLEAFPGGMLFFLGCHLIDLILQIQGMPEEVIPLSTSTGIDDVTAKDFGMAVLKYKNGVSFAKTCASELAGFNRRQLVVCGSKKVVEMKPIENYVGDRASNLYTIVNEITKEGDEKGGWACVPDRRKSIEFDRMSEMLEDFGKFVLGEKKNPYSYEYELKLHKLILACTGLDIDYKEETIL